MADESVPIDATNAFVERAGEDLRDTVAQVKQELLETMAKLQEQYKVAHGKYKELQARPRDYMFSTDLSPLEYEALVPDPVGDALLASHLIGKAGKRLGKYVYGKREPDSAEIEAPEMRMDGMGAGPKNK